MYKVDIEAEVDPVDNSAEAWLDGPCRRCSDEYEELVL
jgi:hypothetical protein